MNDPLEENTHAQFTPFDSSTKLPVRVESGAPEVRPNSNLRWYKCAIEKRMKWIYYKNPVISKINVGVLCLSPDLIGLNKYLDKNSLFELTFINTLNIQNENKSVIFEWSKIFTYTANSDMNVTLQIEYIENEYPTIITRLKTMLNSNNPYTIRSHFIPMILAKYISENMPEMKHVFLAEPFTYDWIESNTISITAITS